MVRGKSLSEKLAINELKEMGFSNLSQREIELYILIGVKDFKNILDTVFEYVCLECECIGKPKKGKEFIELYNHRRADLVEQSLDRIKKSGNEDLYFKPPTREEMMEMIDEQYGKSKD